MKEFKSGIYLHYKGKKYLTLGIAKHSETLEEMVVYVNLYENDHGNLWVRPLKMFQGDVEVEGKKVPRFKFIQSY